MKILNVALLSTFLLSTSACSVFLGQPNERVADYDDVKLCILLADKTFKYHAEWHWAISDEILKRNLDKSKKCESTYNNRTERLMRKLKATPVSFSESLKLK